MARRRFAALDFVPKRRTIPALHFPRRRSFTVWELLVFTALCVVPLALLRFACGGSLSPPRIVAGLCGIFLLGFPLGAPVGFAVNGRYGMLLGAILGGMIMTALVPILLAYQALATLR